MSKSKKKKSQPQNISAAVKVREPLAAKSPVSLTWADVRSSAWVVPLVCVGVLVTAFSMRQLTDIDIGFHLRGGKWITENLSFPDKDVYTYTVRQNDYIDAQWFYQVLAYTVFRLAGYDGLSVWGSMLVIGVFGLLFWRMKIAGFPVWLIVLGLLSAALIMEIRFLLRPEVMTWMYLILTLIVLDLYFSHNRNVLFWLPVLQVFWVNSQGLFILGWGMMGAYVLSVAVHRRMLDRSLILWSGAAVIASLINPYFFKGVMFPFYLFTRLQASSVFNSEIDEFQNPWHYVPTDGSPFLPVVAIDGYYVLSIASGLLMLLTLRRRKAHDVIVWAAMLYLSVKAIRNVPLLVIVAVQLLLVCIEDVLAWLKGKSFVQHRLELVTNHAIKFVPFAASLLILGLAARVITDAYYVSDRRVVKTGSGLYPYSHPCGAADFLLRNKLNGQLLNDLNSGSWLEWQVPQPVFIDGRLEVMREDFFAEYLTSFQVGGLKRLIHKFQPKLIVFDYAASLAWNVQLQELTDWRMIYCDEQTAIFARNDYAIEFPKVAFTDVARAKNCTVYSKNETDKAAVWQQLEPPTDTQFATWLEGFVKSQSYPYHLVRMGNFSHQNSQDEAAEAFYLAFLRQTKGHLPELYFNLGSAYYKSKDFKKAKRCYEIYLKSTYHPLAERRVHDLQMITP